MRVAVDLSCGTGIVSREFVKCQLAPQIVAIDYSESMLAVLQQKISPDNLAIVRGDVEALPLTNDSVDAVYCGAAMHCWENPDRAIENIYRVLRPGGKLYLTTFLQPLPSIIFRFFSPQELADIFKNGGFLKESLEIKSRGVYATIKCIKN